MSQTVIERTADNIAESAHQASRATGAIADAIGGGMGIVKHAAKQGCDAGEEFLNETTHRLHRHLALTVATTFAVGATAGAFIGWFMKRRLFGAVGKGLRSLANPPELYGRGPVAKSRTEAVPKNRNSTHLS